MDTRFYLSHFTLTEQPVNCIGRASLKSRISFAPRRTLAHWLYGFWGCFSINSLPPPSHPCNVASFLGGPVPCRPPSSPPHQIAPLFAVTAVRPLPF